MNKTILIIPFAYWGPINGSLKFARMLQSSGYNVVYIVPKEFQDFLELQKFSVFVYNKPPKTKFTTRWGRLKSHYLFFKSHNTLVDKYAHLIVEEFRPSLFIVDSDVPRYAAALQKYGPVLTYSITPSNNKTDNIPPYFSKYIPNPSKLSRLLVNLIWFKWFSVKGLYILKYELLSLGYFDFYLKKYRKERIIQNRNIDRKRAWPVGFKHIPELLLYPQEFDFGKQQNLSNKFYIGPMVEVSREGDSFFDWSKIVKSEYLICCSMGTLAEKYYPDIEKFYELLYNTILSRENVTLILVIGKSGFASHKVNQKNIFIYKEVPLLKVLDRCDLLISHGGFNTVKESILKGIPMLLLPLNKQNDQNGVAARCVFHNIAKKQDIKRTSVEKLWFDIDDLLTNTSYKDNALRMRNVFASSEWDTRKLLSLVNSKIKE